MNNPLLQKALPVVKPTMPQVWLVRDDTGRVDRWNICVQGIGQIAIPEMVYEAVHELEREKGMAEAMAWNVMGRMPSCITEPPRMDLLLLALALRYEELSYVEYEYIKG